MNIIKGQHMGIIPCRAGSKRFPGKNRALFGGIPLYQRAVQLSMSVLDSTLMTSDDAEILANVDCEKHIRPAHLATGNGYRIDDVLIDIANTIREVPEFMHLIQVTSPFLYPYYIEEGRKSLNQGDFDSVQLVVPVSNSQHSFSQRKINNDGTIEFCYPEDRNKHYNSQSKPVHYSFAGYVGFKAKSLLETGSIWGKKSKPIIGDHTVFVDIDNPYDLEYAEFILWKKSQEVKRVTSNL